VGTIRNDGASLQPSGLTAGPVSLIQTSSANANTELSVPISGLSPRDINHYSFKLTFITHEAEIILRDYPSFGSQWLKSSRWIASTVSSVKEAWVEAQRPQVQ